MMETGRRCLTLMMMTVSFVWGELFCGALFVSSCENYKVIQQRKRDS